MHIRKKVIKLMVVNFRDNIYSVGFVIRYTGQI